MKNEIFVKFDNIGELRMDKVLFESYHPILFTCLNEKNEIYLCVCCKANSEQTKWLIGKVTASILIKLLQNKVTIRDAFLHSSAKYSIVKKAQLDIKIIENDANDWDPINSIYLPTAGEYMDAEENEFDEEIEYFKQIHYFSNIVFIKHYKIHLDTCLVNDIELLQILQKYYLSKYKSMFNRKITLYHSTRTFSEIISEDILFEDELLIDEAA